MSEKKDAIFNKRAFLNMEGHNANALASVRINNTSRFLSLVIRDCENQVEITNSFRTPEDHANALFKLRTLRAICDAAIQQIELLPAAPPAKKRVSRKNTKKPDA